MATLKVADTTLLSTTPVALLNGSVAITVGGGMAAVVKLQT